MRVALVVHDLHERGGHSLYTRVLADELSRHHQVTVFANRCDRPDDAPWQFCKVDAWRQSALSTVHTFPLGMGALGSELRGFDIRHMQGYCGGRPNVVTAHICVAAYLDSVQSISMRNRVSLKLMAAVEGRFYRRYQGPVIAISRKIERELREFYGVRGAISVVPHGVDTSRFDSFQRQRYRSALRNELGLNEGQMTALYIGDLTKAHVHLKALAAAAPETPFIIVSGSTRYRWHAPNVRFLPRTAEVERYYAAADAFVFPTTYDAFGMVLLEAMSAGLPVFSSDQAGAAELIRHGEDGFVFPLEDWVEATVSQLSNRAELAAVGSQAEKTAGLHDWSTVVRDVEQVYRQTAAHTGVLLTETPPGEYRYQR